jgi:hypothetical protein
MSTIEFQPWPKIARLNRNIIITEKLDGTNAAIVIVPAIDIRGIGAATVDRMKLENPSRTILEIFDAEALLAEGQVTAIVNGFAIYAQSRNKFITPGKSTDNYGFAGWVRENAEALVATLGEGTHFGEWWGAGIQRGYGLTGGDKRFSLFNAQRWGKEVVWRDGSEIPALGRIRGLGVVPVLYDGTFHQSAIDRAFRLLRDEGSQAAPGFLTPEGIVVYHTAARTSFKVTLEGDAAPAKVGTRRPEDLLPTETIGLAA